MGEVMSNDVQSHDTVVERAAAGDRRTSGRHAAATLGAVQARLIGGSPVDLVNFSSRGVLFECDSRLLIGARASVRISSPDHNLIVTGRVVRSRVKGLVNGALRYDAALALDHDFALTPSLAELMARLGAQRSEDLDGGADREPVEDYLAESEASLVEAVRARDGRADVAPVAEAPAEVQETPAGFDEAAVAADEPVAFEADGDVAFEPAIEFAIDPAVEFAFEGGEEVAFESEAPVALEAPADGHDLPASAEFHAADPVAEVTAAEPDAPAPVSFFDPTPRGMQDRGVFEDGAGATEPAGDSEPVVEIAASAGEAVDSPVVFEAEDTLEFEPAFEPVDAPLGAAVSDAALPGSVIEPETMSASAHAPEQPADLPPDQPAASLPDLPPDLPAPLPDLPPELPVEAALETLPDPSPAPLDVEDRVLQQFAATVPQDLADLRRIAADNQW
jgi:hypothetical protein